MLITFKSKAGGDVIMFGEIAQQLLKILGKDSNEKKGIITSEQLPTAISQLQQAIKGDKATSSASSGFTDEDDEAAKKGIDAPVSLAQRATPLLDLLQSAQSENTHVIWES